MKTIILMVGLAISGVSYGATCTDFSGNWKGQCTSTAGKTAQSSMAITQTGCSALSVNTQAIPIGGSSVLSSWAGDIYTVVTNALWFSPDQKTMEFSIFTQSYKNNALVYQSTTTGYDELVGGKFITHSKGTYGDITCTYESAR